MTYIFASLFLTLFYCATGCLFVATKSGRAHLFSTGAFISQLKVWKTILIWPRVFYLIHIKGSL